MHSPLWMIVHDKMWHVNYSVTHFICRRVPSMPSVLVIDEQPSSAIWNSEALSQNFYKIDYRKITKNYCKSPSKELQCGYRKGKALLDHEIFFFLFFWNIGCPPSSSGCSPSQLSADTAQAIFRFVCKRARLVSDGLFCVRKSREIDPQRGKV